MDLEIDFQHVTFSFSPELEKMTSPHFSDSEAKQKLGAAFFSNKNIAYSASNHLEDDLIIFANEAFPESAVNDPLGDLRIWDLWQTGKRAFPYPGKYIPLEIFSQGTKVKSTSSMGVLGECLCGLYATAGIGPWPIVRVINRWPDFIFHDRNKKKFALMESKAFADINGSLSKFEDRFDKSILQEFLLDALKHLVSDRSVSVWGSFTSVKSVDPFRAQVTFVETTLEGEAASSSSSTVVDMLAEYVLQVALNKLLPELGENGEKKAKKLLNFTKDEVPENLTRAVNSAFSQLPSSVVGSITDENKIQISDEAINGLIKNKNKILNIINGDNDIGHIRRGFKTDAFEAIREVGEIRLEARRLNEHEADEVDRNWFHSWDSVGRPFKIEETAIFRCGGLLIKKKYLT